VEFTGRLKEPIIDFKTRRLSIIFEPNEDFRETYDELKDCEKLKLEIKPYRAKRSLNANAYFHVLVGKIANKVGSSKPAIKNLLLSKYGQYEIENDSLVHLIIREDIDVSEREDIHLSATSAVKELDDGNLYRVYRLMRGSHTFNSAEMAKLIEGTISDAKEIGISDSEIATPDEKRILKERYNIDV